MLYPPTQLAAATVHSRSEKRDNNAHIQKERNISCYWRSGEDASESCHSSMLLPENHWN